MKRILIAAIIMVFPWSAIDLSAQTKNTAVFKDLIFKKFDRNQDGVLTGLEKDNAIRFLKGADRNGDGNISDTEQSAVIDALRQMPDHKKPDPKSLVDSDRNNRAKLKKFYEGSTIITLEDIHTVVPKGSVLHVPEGLAKMIVKQPKGEMMFWPEFLQKYPKLVITKEVTWKTAKGEDPIKGSELKAFVEGGKIVVAVFKKNPLSVLEPASKKK